VSGASLTADLTAPGNLAVQGDVAVTGVTQVNLTPAAYMSAGAPFPLLSFTGSLLGTGTFAVANPANYRQANVITESNSVKVDLGSKSLKWSGATNVWEAIGAANFTDGAPQQFYSGDTVTFDDTASTRAVALTGALQPARMIVDTTLGYTLTSGTTGSIAGGTSILKMGPGTLVLGMANTFTGGITVSSGMVELGASGAAGGTGTITLGDANTGSSAVAVLNSGTALTYANPITVSALGTGTATIGSSVLGSGNGSTFSGLITLNRPTTLQARQTDKTLFAGQITGPVGTLTIAGGKRVTLRSTANDFVGNIAIIDSGTILQSSEAGAGETIPNGSSIDVGAGTVFRTAGAADSVETINGLTGSGTVTRIVAGLQTLVVGSAGGGGTFSGPITNGSGIFALKKIGAGTEILAGASTYTGATTVEGGVLAITGSLTGTFTTVAGGTLEGTGTVGALTLTSGTLSAGSSSIGTLNTGNLALNGGSLLFELLPDATSDRLNSAGTITFAGNVQLDLGFGADLAPGTAFTLITNDLADPFGFTSGGLFAGATPITPGIDFTYTSGGFTEIFRASYAGGDGNDFTLTVVPEPGSAVLLLGGMASVVATRRRRAGRVG
jgi:fibronectin-binding autotransporter adhesin